MSSPLSAGSSDAQQLAALRRGMGSDDSPSRSKILELEVRSPS